MLQGADVDALDQTGQTPLHAAALRGYDDVARVLIAGGADVQARDRRGHTPLDVAARSMQRQMVEFLIANGADTEAKDNEGRTASAVSGRPGPHGPGWRRGDYLALGQAAMRKPSRWLTW